MNERIVYLCSTPVHLMNCIVAQMTVNREFPADIVLQNVTDFSELRPRLQRCRVFEEIYDFDTLRGNERLHELTGEERAASVHRPSELYPMPELKAGCTVLCANLDSNATRFFYYGLLEKGLSPRVDFVSEGTSTYAMDFCNTERDGLDHAHYGEGAFLKHIGKLWCYRPELYTGGSELPELMELPVYDALPEEVRAVISDVFGTTAPIREKLIFFEGTFWGDGMLTDEIRLFLAIADHIGRENVIVKRHPRNTVDRFTPLGFKVMERQTVPWEVMIKDEDLSHKVLVSVASFTGFSALEMYGRPSLSLLLKDVMRGKVSFLEDPGYRRFFQQAEQVYNRERVTSWSPKSMNELEMTLDVLEQKVGGWRP